jgi:hypothetical protein
MPRRQATKPTLQSSLLLTELAGADKPPTDP